MKTEGFFTRRPVSLNRQARLRIEPQLTFEETDTLVSGLQLENVNPLSVAIVQTFVLEFVVLGRDRDTLCFFESLLLWSSRFSRLNLGRHVSGHDFLFDRVVAPEAEIPLYVILPREEMRRKSAHLPFLFQFGNPALHVNFHGKISKRIFLMSNASLYLSIERRTLVLVRFRRNRTTQDKAIKMIEIRFKNDRSA